MVKQSSPVTSAVPSPVTRLRKGYSNQSRDGTHMVDLVDSISGHTIATCVYEPYADEILAALRATQPATPTGGESVGCGTPGCTDPKCEYGKGDDAAAALARSSTEIGQAVAAPREPMKTMLPFTMVYKNYRGEVATRVITPISVRFGTSEWHPGSQWLMKAFDHEKQAEREFAMADIGSAGVAQPSAEIGQIPLGLRGHARWLRNYRSSPRAYHDPLPAVPDALDGIADDIQELITAISFNEAQLKRANERHVKTPKKQILAKSICSICGRKHK